MPEAEIVLARFLHYASVLTIFGVLLFPLYTYPGRAGGPPARMQRLMRPAISATALAALLSGSLWFASVVVNMTGTSAAMFDRDALWTVLSDTSFGKVSAARFLLMVIILGLVAVRATSESKSLHWLMTGLSAALLVSVAGVGHTQIHDGIDRLLHLGADGLHLLAAGAWLGGLVPLFYLVVTAVRIPSPEHEADASDAALRFSGMGYVAVATIVGSGLLNGWFLVGSAAGLIETPYGRLLLLKLGLFAAMLTLAALNRFWLVPSLIRDNEKHRPARELYRLCGHILGEWALGLLIILIVSAIGTMDPAINAQR